MTVSTSATPRPIALNSNAAACGTHHWPAPYDYGQGPGETRWSLGCGREKY